MVQENARSQMLQLVEEENQVRKQLGNDKGRAQRRYLPKLRHLFSGSICPPGNKLLLPSLLQSTTLGWHFCHWAELGLYLTTVNTFYDCSVSLDQGSAQHSPWSLRKYRFIRTWPHIHLCPVSGCFWARRGESVLVTEMVCKAQNTTYYPVLYRKGADS